MPTDAEQLRHDPLVGTKWKTTDVFGWNNTIEITGNYNFLAGGWEYVFLTVHGKQVKGRKTKRIADETLRRCFERMSDA